MATAISEPVCTSNATLFDAKEGVFEDCFPSSLYAGGLPPHHVLLDRGHRRGVERNVRT
jgi:hypothetical protein